MKLTKDLNEYQQLKLKDLIYEEKSVEEIREQAAKFLISEGFDADDVQAKIVDIDTKSEVAQPVLRAASVWCIMFPWFCE